jgi:subtilisin family serine protease
VLLENQTKSRRNYESVPTVNAAILNAIGNGAVVCVTAGNGGHDADLDAKGRTIPPTGSLLVGYTDYAPGGNPAGASSNWGSRIVVSAPGAERFDVTCSSLADYEYRCGFGGTSGAAPKVAGTVALMLEVDSNLSHSDIVAILRSAGPQVFTAKGQSMGAFLNAGAAVRAVHN